MTYHQGIISIFREFSPGRVCHGDIFEDDAGLEGEGRYNSDFLVGDQFCIGIFRLVFGTLYGI